jgi:hypothetical protein
MLLSPSLKRTGFTIALVFVLAGFVAAQTSRHRKRAKRPKTLVTCSHHISQGTLCGPPVTLVTNADAVPKNTVTVQVTMTKRGTSFLRGPSLAIQLITKPPWRMPNNKNSRRSALVAGSSKSMESSYTNLKTLNARAQHNKSLDASGGSVFRKIIGPAMIA